MGGVAARRSRNGRSPGRSSIRPAARSITCWKTVRFWRRVTRRRNGRPTSRPRSPTFRRSTRSARAPERSRTCRWAGRAGRSTGLCALTEFSVDVLSPEPGAKSAKVKFTKVLADANPAEAELDPMFADKTNKKRVTGPIAYAIDGDQLTAWGIDVGPGRSNVPRTAVFVPEKPIANAAGTKITFHLTQNHGGWNSDDNQNNNLGRFRLSVTGDAIPDESILPTSVAAGAEDAGGESKPGPGRRPVQPLANDGSGIQVAE